MFVIQKDKKIIITKGDTASIFVQVVDLDNKEYEIKPDDVITFTVRKSANSEASISKTATSDHYIILEPTDTKDLKTGLYVYDVQLKIGGSDDAIYTIVPQSFFEIRNEVTR